MYSRRQSACCGFDAAGLSLTGEPVTVLENVFLGTNGASFFAIAENGTLVYYAAPSAASASPWHVDTAGQAQPLGVPGNRYQYTRVSHDGRWVAYWPSTRGHD